MQKQLRLVQSEVYNMHSSGTKQEVSVWILGEEFFNIYCPTMLRSSDYVLY